MKKIGLIDIDGHHFPNLPLMKLSAWHKNQGDHVEWYYPLISDHMNRVYMSKVFSFSPAYDYFIDSDEVVKGGSGFAITTSGGVESYDKTKDKDLPEEVEHIYPDYSLYPSVFLNLHPVNAQSLHLLLIHKGDILIHLFLFQLNSFFYNY